MWKPMRFFCCLLSLKLGVGASTTTTACFSLECCILSVTSALAFGKGHRVDWLCPVTWLTERARDWVKAATHIFAPCALFWYRSLTRQKGNERKIVPCIRHPRNLGYITHSMIWGVSLLFLSGYIKSGLVFHKKVDLPTIMVWHNGCTALRTWG